MLFLFDHICCHAFNYADLNKNILYYKYLLIYDSEHI